MPKPPKTWSTLPMESRVQAKTLHPHPVIANWPKTHNFTTTNIPSNKWSLLTPHKTKKGPETVETFRRAKTRGKKATTLSMSVRDLLRYYHIFNTCFLTFFDSSTSLYFLVVKCVQFYAFLRFSNFWGIQTFARAYSLKSFKLFFSFRLVKWRCETQCLRMIKHPKLASRSSSSSIRRLKISV